MVFVSDRDDVMALYRVAVSAGRPSGEPLLELGLIRRILDYVDCAASPGLEVELRLMTNGLLLDEETFLMLAHRKVEIRLSCDGVVAARSVRNPDNPNLGESVLNRLAQINRQVFHDTVVVAMTVLPATVPWLASGVAYLLERGVGRIEMGPILTSCPGWDETDFSALRNQFGQLVDICLDYYKRTGDVPLTLLRHWDLPRPPRRLPGPVCNAGRTCSPAMDVDGRWYSCGLFADSSRRNDRVPSRVTGALCWEKPGTVEFQNRVASHAERVAALPAFQEQPARLGLFGRCTDCEHFEDCRVCPLALLPDQLHTPSPRVPGFLCAFNALADQARREFPCLPTTPAMRLQSQILARQEDVFLQKARDLLS